LVFLVGLLELELEVVVVQREQKVPFLTSAPSCA